MLVNSLLIFVLKMRFNVICSELKKINPLLNYLIFGGLITKSLVLTVFNVHDTIRVYVKMYIKEDQIVTTLTATKARQNFFDLLKKSSRGHVPVKIAFKEGDVVLISEEDYESLLETLELLSTPGVLKGLREARKDIKTGRTKSLKEVFKR